ncbi:hypothetical protein BDV33DRAFT_210120 [Aspergillus novoparasiticus]|uniref:Uncharacterized protein n=1 Tax=Aspergillus novoparasiticus TaxID=986946 RepID=A0A5N6E9Q6_9EURO|nr:hypothetical protein BDV33DRAFT_210120 [Aspergillus novoparasiticus]
MRLLWLLAWLALAVSANGLRPGKYSLRHTQKGKHGIRKRAAASYQADRATRGDAHAGGNEHRGDEDVQQREAPAAVQLRYGTPFRQHNHVHISRKGVYATHWWENVSFNPEPLWRNPADQTNDEIFQAIVIDM